MTPTRTTATSAIRRLKPYRAKSYDLEFAYYPTDEIEMRVGGFYKDINNLHPRPRHVRAT